MLCGDENLKTAKDFAGVATEACYTSNIIYLSSDTVNAKRERNSQYVAENPQRSIPNIHKIHYAKRKNSKTLTAIVVKSTNGRHSILLQRQQTFSERTIKQKINRSLPIPDREMSRLIRKV
jgi:hypothetical protein